MEFLVAIHMVDTVEIKVKVDQNMEILIIKVTQLVGIAAEPTKILEWEHTVTIVITNLLLINIKIQIKRLTHSIQHQIKI